MCVQLRSYDSVRTALQDYVSQPEVKVWVGTEYTNYALYELIRPQVIMDHGWNTDTNFTLEFILPGGSQTFLDQ